MELHEMTTLIRTVWSDSMSDNGAIWADSYKALTAGKDDASKEIVSEAYRLARERWKKMHNVAD